MLVAACERKACSSVHSGFGRELVPYFDEAQALSSMQSMEDRLVGVARPPLSYKKTCHRPPPTRAAWFLSEFCPASPPLVTRTQAALRSEVLLLWLPPSGCFEQEEELQRQPHHASVPPALPACLHGQQPGARR